MSDTAVAEPAAPATIQLPAVQAPAAPSAPPPSGAAVIQNEQGKANSLLNTIADKLERLVTLTVVTAIADIDVVQDDPNQVGFTCRPKAGTTIEAFQTQVNLVTGDIENLISRDFATNTAYHSLTEFHLAQVTKSSDIVSTNLKAIRDLAVQISGRPS
ncbi:hypothetical protein D3869_23150 (plasmid) [Azospirillum brasilense]|uniref:Uncharacterized protein n=1 Tax=Azospirillum brasilense TaxID=192 RepID=A0A4D8R558_AZOBR|nr:hypothetical protein [Azospirillum brasilense]QCO18178.1 hypothetical protein D3869_23150 [Azospirillum brasilense]